MKKILWLGASFLVVAALVLASCGPTVAEGEEEKEVVTLRLGETWQTAEMEVTVSEVVITDSYEYYNLLSKSMDTKEASPGMSYLLVTVTMKNVSDSKRKDETRHRFRVSDSEGLEYATTLYYGGDVLTVEAMLETGREISGKMLFNIPEGASDLKIAYWDKEPPIKRAEWEIE